MLAAEAAAEAEAKEAAASASKEAAAPEGAPKDFIKVKQEIDGKRYGDRGDEGIEFPEVVPSMPEQKLPATRALHKPALPTFFLWVWQMHHSVFVQGGQYMKGPSGALQAGRKI